MVIKSINQVLNGVVIASIVIMMLSTTADVAGRYLVNNPIPGTVELNRTLLVFTAFLAAGYTQLRKQHIRVDLLLNRLSSKSRLVIDGLVLLLALVVIGFITYGGSVVAYTATVQGEYETGLIRFPMWPGRIALALGLLVLCVQYVVEIIDSFRSSLRRQSQR